MEAAVPSRVAAQRRALPFVDAGAVSAWVLGFAPLAYLGLRGGGYDTVVWSEIGIAVWWLVLVGLAVGVLPAGRLGRLRGAALVALLAFAAWETLGLLWSASPERTLVEVSRTLTYAGVLALALTALDARTARACLHGLGAAFVVIGSFAVASRIRPEWFPSDDVVNFMRGGDQVGQRLNYPINYSDGLGAILAMGLPVLLAITGTARTIAGRAAASASLPVIALGIYLSGSRTALLAVVMSVLLLLAFDPDRLVRLAHLLVAGCAMGIVMAAASALPAFHDNLGTALARDEAGRMTLILVVVSLGAGLLSAAVAQLAAGFRPRRLRMRERAGVALALAALIAVVVVAVPGVSSTVGDKWSEFRSLASPNPVRSNDPFVRLGDLSGSNRYQYWESAARAFRSDPVTGTGAGTFEFWWARDGKIEEFIRDAHSVYFETLAETGLVGFALLMAGFALLLAAALRGALRRRVRVHRVAAAAGAAGFLAFLLGAALNWLWEIPVLPIAALVLVAVAMAPERREDTVRPGAPSRGRIGGVVTALLAIVVVAFTLAGVQAVRASQSAAARNDLPEAAREAAAARRLQPFAATPYLQSALVLERAGALDQARADIDRAIARSEQDWRLWLVRSRILAQLGETGPSIEAYRRARSLNPRSRAFTGKRG